MAETTAGGCNPLLFHWVMKKVIVINPRITPWNYEAEIDPPMGLLLIGTVLQSHGFLVKVIDGLKDENYLRHLESEIDGDILCVGLSVKTAQVPEALKVSEFLREKIPSIKIIWGGVHPTLFPTQTCLDPLVDIIVLKEGEFIMLELAKNIIKGGDLSEVKGIAYKKDKNIIITPPGDVPEINNLPPINYELVKVEDYLSHRRPYFVDDKVDSSVGVWRKRINILSGKGCPYRCNFCINSITSTKYRSRSAELIINDIERLIGKYGIDDVNFVDENFFANKKRLCDLLNLIESKGLHFSWTANVRANYISSYLDETMLRRIEACGCRFLALGAESGSEKILERLNKKITLEQVENTARLTKGLKMRVGYSFMVGMPGETKKDIVETFRFANRIRTINNNAHIIGPFIYMPFPGSAMYDEAVNKGLKVPDTLKGWSKVCSDNSGFFDLEKFPWVESPNFIRKRIFYLSRIQNKVLSGGVLKKATGIILSLVSTLRVRMNFYAFSIEYMVFKAILKRNT